MMTNKKTSGGRPGPKNKSVDDKESKTVALKLTPDQYKNLKKNAGHVPLATFLKIHLKEKTNFFK